MQVAGWPNTVQSPRPRSLLLHVSVQTASLLNWRALPASETAQRALSVVAVLAFYLLPTVAPRLYLRWRTQALLANRLVFFAFPLLRKPRGGPRPQAQPACKYRCAGCRAMRASEGCPHTRASLPP